jgi:signal peptidase I
VAFVLAFIFRAFVVEAFVIPTGSMGPTLYGAHLEYTCSDCGFPFSVGADGHSTPEPVCPNCLLRQQFPNPPIPPFSGDRILVLKFIYDFQEPERWDVIVFHNPNDPSVNYIKRLVALPGETVELVRGDVTINGCWVQKPDLAQHALWMLVHDTAYKPTRRTWAPRWRPEGGWAAQDHGFNLPQALDRDRVSWLTYVHREGSGEPLNILDFYAYNGGLAQSSTVPSVCTDLSVKTHVTLADAASTALVELRAYKDRFRFELTARGSDQPTRILCNDKVLAWSQAGVLPVGRAVDVQVANVDHKLVLLVDGARVADQLSGEAADEGDPLYEPTPLSADELERYREARSEDFLRMAAGVRVGGRGGPVRLGSVRLDRDVYYTNEQTMSPGLGQTPGHGTQGNPLALTEGEYFVCGDNSPKSFDARLWPLDRPVVPRRNLVGQAFFVYWPSAGTRWYIPLAPDPLGWRLVN